MSGTLTHLDDAGRAVMVDVGDKDQTLREASAVALVAAPTAVMNKVAKGELPKGDLFAAARIAGIQGAKRTSDLIPLCHPLPLTKVQVELELDPEQREIRILCTARCVGRTGVEMEALTGASIAALTVYDMLKGLDKGVLIRQVRLLSKSGGKSGDWRAPQ